MQRGRRRRQAVRRVDGQGDEPGEQPAVIGRLLKLRPVRAEAQGQFPGRQGKAGMGEGQALFRRPAFQRLIPFPQRRSVPFAIPFGKKQASPRAWARVSDTA